MSRHRAKWLGVATGAVCAAALLTGARAAHAHGGDEDREKASTGTATPSGQPAQTEPGPKGDVDEVEEGYGDEREEAGPVYVGLDMVIGLGKTPTANQTVPGPLGVNPINTIDAARVTTESFLLAGGVHLGHWEFGALLPLTFGSLNPANLQARSTTASGNLELEAGYGHRVNEHLELTYSLGIGLPTAQGSEIPDSPNGLIVNGNGVIDQNSYDRAAINRAAASSRGWEENGLFEPRRFGIIPKIALAYRAKALVLEPYVKLENLIDTTGNAANGYIGELVIGGRAAYRVLRHLEPGVRIWTNLELAGPGDKPVGVVEPEVRFPFHAVTPIIGGILPFAGPLTSPYFAGIRIAVSGRF